MKVGAVACIVFLDPQFSIDLQLIGGVIILQTLPAVALGLYTRWFHRGGLIAGWVAGMGLGFVDALPDPQRRDRRAHFGGSAFPLEKLSASLTPSRGTTDLRRLGRGRRATCWSR